jgi:hypothetical protein
MEDDAAVGSGAPNCFAVADLPANDLDPEVEELGRRGLVSHERTHVPAPLEQERDQMPAEKPGGARHECRHAS